MPNPFAALSDNNLEGADKYHDEIDQSFEEESESFKFKSLVTDVKIELPNANFDETTYRTSNSLLACSSDYGYLVAGTCSGFILTQTKKLRDSIYAAEKDARVPLQDYISIDINSGKVNIVALSQDQLQLFVSVSGGTMLVYNIKDIVVDKSDAKPVQSITLDADINYIKPNPDAFPDIVAVCTKNNDCKLIRYPKAETIATIPNIATICWSPKGKQIACGSMDGRIFTYDVKGVQKDDIAPPPSMQAGYEDEVANRYVNALLWIENHVFFAFYARPQAEGVDYAHTPVIVNRQQKDPQNRFLFLDDDINGVFNEEYPDSHFYIAHIRQLGSDIKNLIITATSASTELGVIGQNSSKTWSTFVLENLPSLPLSETDSDTFPVGLAVDYSASEPLPPYDPAEDDTPVPPFPVLYVLSTMGTISSYHLYSSTLAKSGEKHAHMVDAKDVYSIPAPEIPVSVETTQKAPAPKEAPAPVKTVTPPPKATVTEPSIEKPKPEAPSANAVGFQGPSKIPSFSSLPPPAIKQEEVKKEVPTTIANSESEPPKFGSISFFGGGHTAPAQTASFASLAKSSSFNEKPPISGGGFSFGTTSKFGFGATTPTTPSGFGGFQSTSFDPKQPFGTPSFSTPSITKDDSSQSKKKVNDEDKCHFSFEEIKKTIDDDNSFEISSLHEEGSTSDESSTVNVTDEQVDEIKQEEERANAEIKRQEEEEKRITEEKKHKEEEEQRRMAEERRIAEEKRVAEERRIAEEKRIAEEERIAEEKRLEEERLAAIKPDPLFASYEEDREEPASYKRSSGIHIIAQEFEDIYFSTLEDISANNNLLCYIQDQIDVQSKELYDPLDSTVFDDQEYVWKISDSEDISSILKSLLEESKQANISLEKAAKKVDDLCELSNKSSTKSKLIADSVDKKEKIKTVELNDEIEFKYESLQAKVTHIKEAINQLEEKLVEINKKLEKPSNRYESLDLYLLRRTVRDIDQSIKENHTKLIHMEEQELRHTLSKVDMSSNNNNKVLNSASNNDKALKRSLFLNNVFLGVQQRGTLKI